LGTIDFGFCGEPISADEFYPLIAECVLTEELYLVVPLDHLPDRKSVDFREVLNETFIGYNNSTGIRIFFQNVLDQNGVDKKLNISYRAAEDNTITDLVRVGLGIAFIADVPTICTI